MGEREAGFGFVTMAYRIVLTQKAADSLKAIRNEAVREQIGTAIDRLAENPSQLGKSLRGALKDYRSIRAAGQRYRIIYRVHDEQIIVLVIAIGIRKGKDRADVYQILQRLVKRGNDPEKE